MLDQNALVISRHHDDLLHCPIEYGPRLRTFRYGNGDTVVERQFQPGEYRMVMLSETVYHRTIRRPRQFSLICGELSGQFVVNRRRVPLLVGRGLHRLLHEPSDFPVQRIHLPLLGIQFLLILRPVAFKLRNDLCRLPLLLPERFQFRLPLRPDFLRAFPKVLQPRPFNLQFRPCLPDPLRLLLHLRRQPLEIAEPSESLPEIIACEDIHIPYLRIPVFVCTPHKPGIIFSQGVFPRLQPVYLPLGRIYFIGIEPYLTVALGYEGLPVRDLLPYQGELRKGVLRPVGIVGKLSVKYGDLLLEPGLPLLMLTDVLRRCREDKRRGEHRSRQNPDPESHLHFVSLSGPDFFCLFISDFLCRIFCSSPSISPSVSLDKACAQ